MVGPVGLHVRSPNKQGGNKYTSNVDVARWCFFVLLGMCFVRLEAERRWVVAFWGRGGLGKRARAR